MLGVAAGELLKEVVAGVQLTARRLERHMPVHTTLVGSPSMF